jgi:hypothetical protein
MERQIYQLVSPQVRQNAIRAIMQAPDNFRVELRERTRTLDQNSVMWSCLTDLSKQVRWPVNGRLEWMTPEEWKDVITASLHQENKIAQGIRGGFVMLGRSTSKMGVKAMIEVIDFCHAFGDERGVRWSPTSLGRAAA